MSVVLETESGHLEVLRIQGLLRKKEFDAAIRKEVQNMGSTPHITLLVIAEDFEGFEKNEDWGEYPENPGGTGDEPRRTKTERRS